MPKLTADFIRQLTPPDKGNRLYRDTEETGLALRITAAGNRSFVYCYYFEGRERRITIGQYGKDKWTLIRARRQAGTLRQMVDRGEDPLVQRHEKRAAPTVSDLCKRFEVEHLTKLRPRTAREYRDMIRKFIKPALGNKKVAAVTVNDVDALHRMITGEGHPYRANRVVAVLSKMFSLASVRWKWCRDNPTKGIEKNQEQKRERYLSNDELARLTEALAAYEDQQAANVFRLLLLTGARKSEVLSATWDQFDLEAGIWTKPGATTKQKTVHRVPLNAPARQLLEDLQAQAKANGVRSNHIFPGRYGEGHRGNVKDAWAKICQAANLDDVRIHDLRHSYASWLVGSGLSLPVIGALLGHTQPQTTARYAHLADDPLRSATEAVGAIVTGGGSAATEDRRET